MKINKVWIQHYGPLQKELPLEDDINVIQGPNESGKSLLVEALLKKFVDGSVSNTRLDQEPDGFVEFSIEGEGNQKLGDGETLAEFWEEYYNREIRSNELRNIFVVRNGDLSFGDNDFYSHITDKLTGRRVEDIDEVKDALLDAGRITESRMNVSSHSKYNDAGDHLENAKDLRKEVSEYIEHAKGEDLVEKETQYFAAKSREEELKEKQETLGKAKEVSEKQEKYGQLSQEKKDIEDNIEELEDLPDRDELEDIDDRLQELSEEEGEESELTEQKESNLDLAKWSIAAGVIVFGLAALFQAPLIGGILGLVLVGASFYFWNKANNVSEEITSLQVKEEEIVSDARATGLSFETRGAIRGEISAIEETRDELEGENREKKGALENGLGFSADSIQDAIEKAESELEELEASIDDSVDIEYEEGDLEQVEEELGEVEDQREQLEEEINEHREHLREFSKRANQLDFNTFVGERLQLEIENLDALNRLVERLDEFIDALESDAEASRVAIEIFDEIQEEEREETAELFEEGSRATEIFQQITDDRYSRVTYDNENNQLIVEKSTGETFVPKQLSEGTRDQLYLAIRVALGERILEGDPGFFVMDDAFLTSDANRLSIQGKVVEDLAEEGWQIIYLTSKQDAVEELSSRSDHQPIELPALE